MVKVFAFCISGMACTSPWQLSQPTPLAMWIAVIEIDVVGQIVDAMPGDRLLLARLSRTGASSAAVVQICEWHVMQV